MPDIVHGRERRPLVPGRTLFDEADELSVMVPASCQRLGRCHECVVEVRAGADRLSPRTEAEAFLSGSFRLACQARVERADATWSSASSAAGCGSCWPPRASHPTWTMPARRVGDRVVRAGGVDMGAWFGRLLGLAVDVGTTTVVLELVDLETGETAASAALENPQRYGGSDVMSRISYDAVVPGQLRQSLRRALNHELRRLCRMLGVDRRAIVEALLVGNTTMRDLAFGLDVAPIGQLPYRSTTEAAARAVGARSTRIVKLAYELGLLMHPRGRVIGSPIIASHVGADAAADLVAVGAIHRREPFLLIDIGTNTEVVASDGRRLVAASSPAGPAFEGGGVRHGMAGADGAIEAVRLVDGRFETRTIGDMEPEGICGSGLVDLLSELRRAGRLSARGGFTDGAREVEVVPERGIVLTAADVAHLAVAKAATAVGQRVLLRTLGLATSDLRHVYLAGGFANALDVQASIDIGLLLPVDPSRVIRAGNASVAGAKALLLSRRRRAELESVVRRIDHVELESEPDFFDLFTDGCLFEPISA
jgi:uncharacterized 2Fe-2S/4Fe-4S cluster protein (DUF4445 family)